MEITGNSLLDARIGAEYRARGEDIVGVNGAGQVETQPAKDLSPARGCSHPDRENCVNYPYLASGLAECKDCRYYVKPDLFIAET